MRDYLYLGPTPADEPCMQLGSKDWDLDKAREECKRYIQLLEKKFPGMPESCSFRVKVEQHEFGMSPEVVVSFDGAYPESVEYAFRVENNLPATWEDDAVVYGDPNRGILRQHEEAELIARHRGEAENDG